MKRVAVSAFLCLCFSVVHLRAESVWTNVAGGTYGVDGNWDSAAPGVGETAYFLSNATYWVDFASSPVNEAVYFNAQGGTVNLNVGAHTWTLNRAFRVGEKAQTSAAVVLTNGAVVAEGFGGVGERGARCRLEILNGAELVSGYGQVGRLDNANNSGGNSNEVLIAGSGSKWIANTNSNFRMGVASFRDNRIVVSNQGYLAISYAYIYGINNELRITGPGSTVYCGGAWRADAGRFYIYGTSNRVTIADGGLFHCTHNPNDSGASGSTIEVVGEGSAWSNSSGTAYMGGDHTRVIVRDGGTWYASPTFHAYGTAGTWTTLIAGSGSTMRATSDFTSDGSGAGDDSAGVIVSNGALLRATQTTLGHSEGAHGSEALVTGAGSVWTNDSQFIFTGRFNTNQSARLTVRDGGKAYGPTTTLGGLYDYRYLATTGSLVVADAGSLFGASTLSVGRYGTGFLTVTNGGRVRVTSTLYVGFGDTSFGNRVEVYGGKLHVTNTSENASVDCRRGTVSIGENGEMIADAMTIGATGVLEFVAGETGAGALTVDNALTVNGALSELRLDMTHFRREYGANVELVSYGSMPVPFAEDRITVVGVEGVVDQTTGNKITLRIQQGSLLMVR